MGRDITDDTEHVQSAISLKSELQSVGRLLQMFAIFRSLRYILNLPDVGKQSLVRSCFILNASCGIH